MKKHLLSSLFLIPVSLFAQSTQPQVDPRADLIQPISSKFIGSDQARNPFLAGSLSSDKLYKHTRYSGVVIGKTSYDLQTNASIARRILLHDDGTVSAVWTTAPVGEPNWPTRGSGYNFKSTTGFGPAVSSRLETDRTGWPNIAVLEKSGTKHEMVMGHISATGGWVLSKNTAIGNSSFPTQTKVLQQLNNKVAIWGRIGTNQKQTIHLISNYFASTADGVPVVTLKGVASPTTYSRSLDGGTTWDKQFITLPGYDSTRTVAGGGDNYAIDVKDNMVAVVIGGMGEDVALYKSTDGGDNFTRIVVEAFEFSPWNGKKLVPTATPAATSDGSYDVLIGNDNKIHVFFGRSFVADADTTADGYNFFPATTALMHWTEGWDSVNRCGGAIDYDQSGTLEITNETFAFPDAQGNLPANVSSATRYGSTSLVSFPSSSMDANGNLYVVFSAPDEGSLSPFNANYRDLYVSVSTDGGISWKPQQNITGAARASKENVFASVAKRADNFLHLIYQEDDLPGTNLQNNGTSNTHPNDEQKIIYKAIPVADILGGLVKDPTSVQKVSNDPKIFFVSQNQPNPFSSETNAIIYMRDGSDLTLQVSDITGKVIKTENLGYHSAGNHSVSINADGLTSGIYLYTLSSTQYSITKKMQVK
jgi:hypothetical protein